MDKQTLIAQIKEQEAELRRLGVQSLALFGSWAEDAHHKDSDVDLLYQFEEGEASLEHFLDLQALLEGVLQRHVDLVSAKYLSPRLADYLGGNIVSLLGPEVQLPAR